MLDVGFLRSMRSGPVLLCAAAAAVVIFLRSRDSRLLRLAKNLRAQKVTIEHAKSLRFKDLTAFVGKPEVISATKALVQAICSECVARHGGAGHTVQNARILLAGFMIAYRREKVFESMGDRERVLFACAGPLVERFEAITSAILAGGDFAAVPSMLSDGFVVMLTEYMARFRAWKVVDEEKLVRRIKDALLALYGAKSQLQADNEPLNQQFTARIEQLRVKLADLVGAEGVAGFDVERRGHIAGPHRRSRLPVRMTNEQLVHELMYNREFQVDENMAFNWEGDVVATTREQFHDEFWGVVLEDLALSNASSLLRVLKEMRIGIQVLHPEEQVFDEARVMGLAMQGLLDTWVVDSVAEVIVRRQDAARALDFAPTWATLRADLVASPDKALALRNAVRFLHDRVDKMRIDAANANLRVISVVIDNNGADYERGKFQEKISGGALTLERTEAWLAAVDAVDMLDSKRIYLKGMVGLVSGTTPVTADSCPETLLLDWPRLAQVQQDFHEWNASFAEVFVNLVSLSAVPMAVPLAPAAQQAAVPATPAFKIAENLNLIVNVNWSVHGETYINILGGVVRI